MFSFIFNSDSRRALPIATFKHGKNTDVLCIEENEVPKDEKNQRNEVVLPKTMKSKFEPMYFEHEGYPNRYYITGPSLCGKSTIAGKLCGSYKKKYPKNDIIVLSGVDKDEALDKYKPKRIEISEKLLDDPIQLEELANSMVVFDDIATMDKDISEELYRLRDKCFNTGRHHNIAVISTEQVACQGKKTSSVILNSFFLVLFPAGGLQQIKYIFKEYLGINSNDLIAKIKKLNSRYIIVHRAVPMFILADREAFFI